MGTGGEEFIADTRIKTQNKLLRHNTSERTYYRVVFGPETVAESARVVRSSRKSTRGDLWRRRVKRNNLWRNSRRTEPEGCSEQFWLRAEPRTRTCAKTVYGFIGPITEHVCHACRNRFYGDLWKQNGRATVFWGFIGHFENDRPKTINARSSLLRLRKRPPSVSIEYTCAKVRTKKLNHPFTYKRHSDGTQWCPGNRY